MTFSKIALLLGFAYLSTLAVAQNNCFLRRSNHPWGRFNTGAWARVRTLTESLDDRGRVKNTDARETTWTLVDADESGYTLRKEVTSHVGNKRFSMPSKTIRYRYDGQDRDAQVKMIRLPDSSILLENKEIPCHVGQVVAEGEGKLICTLHYSNKISPFVLKRVTESLDANKKQLYKTEVKVVAVDMPFKVLSEIRNTTRTMTVKKHTGGKMQVLETQCFNVPGGVVSQSIKQTDNQGRLIERSTVELVEYGLEPPRRRLFFRKNR